MSTWTLEIASTLTTEHANTPHTTDVELKAAISNSARSAVALKLRQAAHETRATQTSQQTKEPGTVGPRPPKPASRQSQTESITSACDAVSIDEYIADVPQYAPAVQKGGALSVLALSVANSTAEPGQNFQSSVASTHLRVNTARVNREYRVLQHYAGMIHLMVDFFFLCLCLSWQSSMVPYK